jgi:hypothetical protein
MSSSEVRLWRKDKLKQERLLISPNIPAINHSPPVSTRYFTSSLYLYFKAQMPNLPMPPPYLFDH